MGFLGGQGVHKEVAEHRSLIFRWLHYSMFLLPYVNFCPLCSKAMLLHPSPFLRNVGNLWKFLFSVVSVILIPGSRTIWARDYVCDKVVPHLNGSVISRQSRCYWNPFCLVLLPFIPFIVFSNDLFWLYRLPFPYCSSCGSICKNQSGWLWKN